MPEGIGVALIGTGMWGKRLASAVRRTPDLRLVTCCSRDEARRAGFARAFDCEAAETLEAAIEHPGVQGALLVTPNYHHKEGALACAERGVPVFIEKPISDRLEDALVIRDACNSAGIVLMIGHCFRRLGAARKTRQILDEGLLGEPLLAEANFSLPGTLTPDKWRYYRENCPGGPLMQLGIHHADTLQYWLGPVASVQGAFAHRLTPAEIDDIGVANLVFESGALGTLTSSYVSPKTFSLRLYGDRAVLDYRTDMSVWPNAEQMDSATTLTLTMRSGSEPVPFETQDMLVEELSEFARCIRGESSPETGAQEGLRALAVVLGALESHQSGRRVQL